MNTRRYSKFFAGLVTSLIVLSLFISLAMAVPDDTIRFSVDSSDVQGYGNSAYPSISASTATCGTWNVVPSPNVGTGRNQLNGVAVISANDVWAVGSGTGEKTLIEHWDGASWNVVPSSLSEKSVKLR